MRRQGEEREIKNEENEQRREPGHPMTDRSERREEDRQKGTEAIEVRVHD